MRIKDFPLKSTVSGNDQIIITDSEAPGLPQKRLLLSQILSSGSGGGGGTVGSQVTVTQADQLSGELRSDVLYVIAGEVDMAGQEIIVPSGGLSIVGLNSRVSKLVSSTPGANLFGNAGTSGSLFISNLTINYSGASSTVFNLNNSASGSANIELLYVNFEGCIDLGGITGYRQVLIDTCGFFSNLDGVDFYGSMSGGIAIKNSLGINNAGTLFLVNPSCSIAVRMKVDSSNFTSAGGGVVITATDANFTSDAGFQINGCVFKGGTPINAIDATSEKCFWESNSGIDETYIGTRARLTATDPTIVAATDTPYKASGTFTATESYWFDSPTSNTQRYRSTIESKSAVIFTGSITSGNNQQVTVILRKYNALTTGYEEIASTTVTTNGVGKAENVSIYGFVNLLKDDTVELWVENNTAINDITIELGSAYHIIHR